MFEFIAESTHTARKTHTCSECNTTIESGQKYTATKCLWDGDFELSKAHVECIAAGNDMMDLLEVDEGRYFIVDGMSNDSDCKDDVLAHCKDYHPAVYKHLKQGQD